MKRAIGRPPGKTSTVINVRIPVTLVHRLDRYLDMLETTTGLRTNRGALLRPALKVFLESKGVWRAAIATSPGLPSRHSGRSLKPACRPPPPLNLLKLKSLEFVNNILSFLERSLRFVCGCQYYEVNRVTTDIEQVLKEKKPFILH
jgi:hypothetical protein